MVLRWPRQKRGRARLRRADRLVGGRGRHGVSRSIVRTPAACRSPSSAARSSRSTARARTRSPTASSARRSGSSTSSSTGPIGCSIRPCARAGRAKASSSACRGTKRSSSSPSKMREAKAQSGGASILPYSYGGSNGLLTQDNIDAQLWRRFGTSRLARTVCAAPTGAANMALYGKMASVTYQDYPEASLIVLWGVNPSASGIHLIPYVRDAQARGAKLIVIDPRTTRARRVGRHPPRRQTRAPTSPSRWPFTASCSRTASPTTRSCASTHAAPTSCASAPSRGPSSAPRKSPASIRPRSSRSPGSTPRARRR